MNRTGIEWTTFSANPLKYRDAEGRVVWGCVHASEGCRHCYSEALAKRYGRGGPFSAHVMKGLTPFMDEGELRHMRKAQRIGGLDVAGGRCFVGDMTDLFGEWVPDELLDRLFGAFVWRRDVTWQVLTKRTDRMRAYSAGMAALAPKDRTRRFVASMYRGHPAERLVSALASDESVCDLPWPLPNVWLGTSVEDQRTADERIPLLLQTPAAVRFVSYEPGLGPIDFDGDPYDGPGWLRGYHAEPVHACGGGGDDPEECGRLCPEAEQTENERLDWLICGGESGPGARPFDLAWARSAVAQCKAAGVPVFCKQGGASNRCQHSSKGGHFECFPPELKVREFPA